MNKKLYPKVIRLKKNVMVLSFVVIALIVMVMVYNIISSTQTKTDSKEVQENAQGLRVPTQNDANWYSAKVKESLKTDKNSLTLGTKNSLPTHKKLSHKSVHSKQKSHAMLSEAYISAMQAPLSSNVLTNDSSNTSAPLNHTSTNKPSLPSTKSRFSSMNDNINGEGVLLTPVKKPISPYEVKAGSQVPGFLLTEINSDLPGEIIGQVRANVYDTVSGNYVLIPQGAKLQGVYDSEIIYGQQRVLVVWKRIIFPNGDSLNIKGMSGTDLKGASGFGDEVDNYFIKIFGSVVLGSVISAGAQLSQPQQTVNSPFQAPSVNQTLAQSVGTEIASTVVTMTNKNLNIQPTLIIRQGYAFNIQVTKDLVFPGPYED